MILAHRYHDISCGHRVVGQGGKCENLHGHNYRIHFSVENTNVIGLDDVGRTIDFGEIKTRLCMWLEAHWDHKMLIWAKDPWLLQIQQIDSTIVDVPFNPTAENMAMYLTQMVGPQQLFKTNVRLVQTVVEETRKCSASYSLPPLRN